MKDFFLFKRMLIPYLVQILFWLGVIACIIVGVADFYKAEILKGLGTLIIGPILVRIFCEYVVVLFRINETLTEIRRLKG